MGQYIGARYVPRFLDTYNATQSYEGLDVVDNGMGTSFIAKQNVPAGTPLTNTTYWAIYGSSSGAIINLQNQIDELKDNVGDYYCLIDDTTGDVGALINTALADGFNVIYLAEGSYTLNTPVTLLPHQRIEGKGVVKIYSTSLTVFNLVGYTDADYQTEHEYYANFNGCWLSNLFLYGMRSGDTCIVFGGDRSISNELYNLVATITLHNLTIRNYETAISWTAFNFYLNSFKKLFIEYCDKGIVSGISGQSLYNSGERILFEDCVFGNVYECLISNAAGFEFNFENCAFDYCRIVINDASNYNKYYIHGGHMEGIGRPGVTDSGIYYAPSIRSMCYCKIEGVCIDYGHNDRNDLLFNNAPRYCTVKDCDFVYNGNGSTIFMNNSNIIFEGNKFQDGQGILTSIDANAIIDANFNNVTLSGPAPSSGTDIGTMYQMGYNAGISDLSSIRDITYTPNGKRLRITGNNTNMSMVLYVPNMHVTPNDVYRTNLIYATNASVSAVQIRLVQVDDNDNTIGVIASGNMNINNDGNDHYDYTVLASVMPANCYKLRLTFDISAANMATNEYFDIVLPTFARI